MKNFEKEKSSP
jgi:hypothetical protein